MKAPIPWFLIFALPLVLLSACKSPEQLLREGQVVRAYERSLYLISQSPRPAPKHFQWLAASYEAVQGAELNRLRLVSPTDSARWFELFAVYDRMLERRRELDPWVPLPDTLQLAPDFSLGYLKNRREEARLAAGAYCYSQAAQHFAPARAGDKPRAREAYHWLERALTFTPEQTQYWAPTRQEMHDWGTVRVLFRDAPNGADGYHEDQLQRYLLDGGLSPWRKDWLEIHFEGLPANLRIDYFASLQAIDADVSPDREDRDTDTYTKEVIDGYKTVEEEEKKGDTTIVVKKEVPIKITVRGSITEVEQEKSACGSVLVVLYRADELFPAKEWILRQCENWSNEYEICEGDERALPHSCSGSAGAYPSDGSMLDDVADGLRREARREVRRYFEE